MKKLISIAAVIGLTSASSFAQMSAAQTKKMQERMEAMRNKMDAMMK